MWNRSKSQAFFWSLVLTTMFSVSSYAAVYNFYFNNVEQGDHGSAQPTVSVNTAEDSVTTETPIVGPLPEKPEPTTTTPQQTPPPSSQTTAIKPKKIDPDSQDALFKKYGRSRISFMGAHIFEFGHYSQTTQSNAIGFELKLYLHRTFALNWIQGIRYTGADGGIDNYTSLEAQVFPLTTHWGRVHVEWALMTGVWSVTQVPGNIGSLYAGTQVSFGQKWKLYSSFRANLGHGAISIGLSTKF